jgi:deoxyribodipyrimidine photo-lyase
VPELARLPTKYLHAPWTAPDMELALAGVTLGNHYPRPMVDHSTARNEALAAFKKLRAFNITA